MVASLPRFMTRAHLLLLIIITTGCAPLEKRVDLTYQRFVNTSGGSGQILVAEPVMEQRLARFPLGERLVGKAESIDLVIKESPTGWLLSALVQELSAAGYDVKTVSTLPPGISKGVQATVLVLSANQYSNLLTLTTVTEMKLEAQLWKNGQILKTLTAGARAQEEGVDRSSEPIRSALEKTLQAAMQGLVPDIVKAFE
jgi:hypothetical protein